MKFIVTIIFLLMLLISLIYWDNNHPWECKNDMVIKVGGCDKYGSCRVLFSNGDTAIVSFPVENTMMPHQCTRK